MDGIYEEVPFGFQDWADLTAMSESGYDVVRAIDRGRRLIGQAEDDCLSADDLTVGPIPRSARALVLGFAACVPVLVIAALLILASGWTL